MKSLLLCCCLFAGALGFSFAQENTGIITGHISAIDNEPLELVSVSIVETSKGTLTDTRGNLHPLLPAATALPAYMKHYLWLTGRQREVFL